ncbi:MAG TPA: hypothetical protein VEQ60_10365, partial [Longimicrobium sp.]|nr:hypothetical protein [Longimicrobium sp.]
MPQTHPQLASTCRGRARNGRLSAPVLALLALAACADEPTSPDLAAAPQASSTVAAGSDADSIIIEPEAFTRFSVQVSTAGSYRPGVPVQIHVKTTAHMSSPSTSLRVVVPELDGHAAEAAPDGKARRPDRKPSRDQWTASLAAGATNQHVTSVVFPKPGIYHVAVEAVHPAEAGALMVGNRPVQHAVGEVVRLEVSERGVRASAARGPVAMGSSIQYIEPCPVQPYSSPGAQTDIDMACPIEPPYEPPPPPPSNVVWVYTAVWYTGPGMTTYDPVRRARVNYSGYGLPTGQATTDEGGYVLLP